MFLHSAEFVENVKRRKTSPRGTTKSKQHKKNKRERNADEPAQIIVRILEPLKNALPKFDAAVEDASRLRLAEFSGVSSVGTTGKAASPAVSSQSAEDGIQLQYITVADMERE